MGEPYTVLNVMGPYREPREPALSYDFSVQRANWATPQGIRVKIGLEEELGLLKSTILELSGGTAGQQLLVTKILSRAIADQKLEIANEADFFNDRRDVMIDPFAGSLAHLFPRLENWMKQEKDRLRQEVKDTVGL